MKYNPWPFSREECSIDHCCYDYLWHNHYEPLKHPLTTEEWDIHDFRLLREMAEEMPCDLLPPPFDVDLYEGGPHPRLADEWDNMTDRAKWIFWKLAALSDKQFYRMNHRMPTDRFYELRQHMRERMH